MPSESFVLREFVRPRVVLSQCLEVEACRHDGQRIRNALVRQLLKFVDVIPICPEVEIGLGTPRDSIRLVKRDGHTALVQSNTGRDLTEQMVEFADRFLERLGPVDGFVLKSGSPSCGTRAIKVYEHAESSRTARHEAGLFARHVLERFDDLAIEDEGRLRNFDLRHHFLSRLYALADLRMMGEEPTMSDLVEFQSRYKYLLLLYDEQRMRKLGRLVANADQQKPQQIYEQYAVIFRQALCREPKRQAHFNVLEHIYGHFTDLLSDTERGEFLQMFDEVRAQHLPLTALLSVIRSWCARFHYQYMADQAYLQPYPHQLWSVRDSGKGVERTRG